MTKPNFFILGAPKCGTTSLAAWLAEHPDVFFCPDKEPGYFNDDTYHRAVIDSIEEYEELFKDATPAHRAIGEGTTAYLFSHTAVPNILDYNPDARFIVSLRNPVTMAPSLHEQRVYEGAEPITDFEQAWKAQFPKRPASTVPRGYFDPKVYEYGPYCRLGDQLERLFTQVPRERVLVVFMDDMKKDVEGVWRSVLDHIGVEDDGRQNFPVHNAAKERRILWIRQAAIRLRSLKYKLGVKQHFGLLRGVEKWNKRERMRKPLPDHVVAAMKEYFADDVAKLSKITGRDLSGWVA